MKNLPMDLLRAFVSVAQLGSFTKAGEILGRSQPAVSLQIQRLEELVDESLLARNGKSLELTDAGQNLYAYANQILNLNDLALSELSKNVVSGKIRLGIPSEFATILLPKIVSRFAKAYPNITLEVNWRTIPPKPGPIWSKLMSWCGWLAPSTVSTNPRWCLLSRQPRAASIASGPQHCWIRSSNPGRLSTPFQT
jgi:hypothetical protein